MKYPHGIAMASVALIAAAAAAPPLAGYVGKYPFDRVRGVSFLAHPVVRQQITRHAPTVLQKTMLSTAVVSGPIGRAGQTIIASMCEPHNCGPHNWGILLSADGTRAAVCHADWEVSQTGSWYQNRVKIADQPDGVCPGSAESVPAAVLNRLAARAPVAAPARPAGAAYTPPAGSAERQAMLAPVRRFAEGELGSPVEFVVKTLNVSGGYGFALLQPVRPGGVRLDPDTTPAAVRYHMANGNLDNFYCCETTAILQRAGNGAWTVRDIRIGATDAWYHAWIGRVPRDLFTQR